jgi:hypothetical protein
MSRKERVRRRAGIEESLEIAVAVFSEETDHSFRQPDVLGRTGLAIEVIEIKSDGGV